MLNIQIIICFFAARQTGLEGHKTIIHGKETFKYIMLNYTSCPLMPTIKVGGKNMRKWQQDDDESEGDDDDTGDQEGDDDEF